MSDSKDLTAAEILALERGERTFKEFLKVELKPCPFCGGAVSECDESPLYGGSIMHDETECLFKNNLLFHGNIAERWNSRPIENALRTRIAELESFLCLGEQLDHLLECYGESDEPMTKGAEAIRDWMQEHVIKPKQRIAELEKSAVVWHRYPEEKPIIGHIYNVTCYHESCLIDKYRVICGVVYSNENDNEQFYAELWNHSLDKSYLTKVSCVIAFSEPLKPYLPSPPEEVSNDNDKG